MACAWSHSGNRRPLWHPHSHRKPAGRLWSGSHPHFSSTRPRSPIWTCFSRVSRTGPLFPARFPSTVRAGGVGPLTTIFPSVPFTLNWLIRGKGRGLISPVEADTISQAKSGRATFSGSLSGRDNGCGPGAIPPAPSGLPANVSGSQSPANGDRRERSYGARGRCTRDRKALSQRERPYPRNLTCGPCVKPISPCRSMHTSGKRVTENTLP